MTTTPPELRSRSLLRTEAEVRAAGLEVHSVLVELDLRAVAAETFPSRSTLDFSSTVAESFVDFKGRSLGRAVLNGRELDPTTWQQGRIPLSGLQARNSLVVEGEMAYSIDGEGLHRHVDPADGRPYLYAMSFLDAGPRWFACFDQPDLKASYRFEVAAPADWTVLGNGPSTSTEPGRWTITPLQPLSTYFVTLVAGPYASMHAEHDGIPLGFHARASLRAELEREAPDMIAVTGQSFDYYHQLFGVRYPFGEYHQAFVPDFNAGAMENPGCVTFRDHFIYRGRATGLERGGRASVIAHEMAHQWFGDLVTMRWWDDLWLNESFAEYMAHRCCTEATRYPLWTEFGIRRKHWGSVADQSPSTHPVAGNGAVDAAAALQDFDGISYAKGASVLRQLAAYLGEDVFLAGLRAYFDRFAFRNAEFAELIEAWTAAGAVDLGAWAEVWLRTAGMDTLDVVGSGPEVRVVATGPGAERSPRTHALTVGAVARDGDVHDLAQLNLQGRSAALTVPDHAVLVVPDRRDDTWAKVRFGPDGWAQVAEVLPQLDDEPVLVVVYNAVRDAVREASIGSAEALDLVCGSLARQRSDVLLSVLGRFAAESLAGPYSPVAERAERLRRVHAVAQEILAGSEPGSDRQLIGFRLAVATATDADLLRGWYDGRGLPEALELDLELTWSIVARLVAVGGDPAVIDQTLEHDRSSASAEHAARARASIPTAAAKEAAWRLMMSPSGASAYEVYATGAGFWMAGQEELTEPYVARYFDEIGGTADFRSGWALGEVAENAFPVLAATDEAVRQAENLLDSELPALIRRAVVDGLDQLRRALTSLQRGG